MGQFMSTVLTPNADSTNAPSGAALPPEPSAKPAAKPVAGPKQFKTVQEFKASGEKEGLVWDPGTKTFRKMGYRK